VKHPSAANDAFGPSVEHELERATRGAAFRCLFRAPDDPDAGPLSGAELLVLLNQLLEGERAGARGVGAMSRQAADPETRAILREIAGDEAHFCAMLLRHVARLGGTPSAKTGAFYTKLAALEGTGERLDLLNRGQGWVVRKLSEALPRIADAALRADLRDMLEAHLRNIERCAELGSERADRAPRDPRGAT
jgi:nitronate monooxygenase